MYSNNAQILLTRESEELERRIAPITQEMNEKPLRVNTLTWVINRESAEESANFLIDFARYLADDDWFRPNSTADCGKVLFINRGLKPMKVSKKSGLPLTDADTLQELTNQGDSLAPVIVDARSAIVRHSQLKAWAPYAKAGEVQAIWNSLGTPHGRYTSENPCLNNRIVPIRETIEADDGYTFLSLDLSQAEYVTWASLSGDLNLSRLFRDGRDFHTEMAQDVQAMVPGWRPGEDIRQAGKTLNFALLYMMQPVTLARKLGCSVELANKITTAYFSKADTAHRYTQRILDRARSDGFIETYFGRRRYCPELKTVSDDRETHECEKTAWNHHVAGTAAELLKFKQVRCWEAMRKAGLTQYDVRLSLNMYDQLVWHVHDNLLPEVRAVIQEVWTQKEPGFLPFQTKIKLGRTWGEIS